MKTQSFFKTLFFPLLILFNLMGLGAFFFQQGGHLLIPAAGLNVRLYSLLSSIAFSIGFIWVVSKFPARQVFSKILVSLALFLGGSLTLLFSQTTAAYFYCLTSFLSPLLFSLLVWGFVNQITTFAESLKYYIPLTFLSGITTALSSFLNIHLGSTPLVQARIFITGSALCVLFSWLIYRRLIAKLPEERWQANETVLSIHKVVNKTSLFAVFKIGFAGAAFGILNSFLNLAFKTQVQTQYSSPIEYTQFMGSYSMTLGIGVLALSILSLMGTFVIQRKGWSFTALITPFATLAALLFFAVGMVCNFYPLQFGTITQIMTHGLNTGLLFPLIQMIYLTIPKESRLKTQLWAELFIAPFFLGIAPLIIQGLLVQFGTIAAIAPYLIACAFLTITILTRIVFSLRKQLV